MRYVRFLLGGSLLLVGSAHAQATFSFGPRAGLNIATAHYPNASSDISHASRAGFEAGLTSNIQFGRFALQPSVLFSQKGYSEAGARTVNTARANTYKQQVRLNYLTVPLNLAFTLGHAGQGLQVFAGPYMSLFVGGRFEWQGHFASYQGSAPYDAEGSGKVKPANLIPDYANLYSRRFDAGLQAGLGYRFGGLLVQAGYSVGLRNLGVPFQFVSRTYDSPAYYNQAFQASLSYLVGKG